MKALISPFSWQQPWGRPCPPVQQGTTVAGTMPIAAATDGIRRMVKVDRQGQDHDQAQPAQNLGMPGMTMVFKAASMDMLKKGQTG